MNKGISLTALALLLPLSFSCAQTSPFSRNLSVGSRGEDVRSLQILLNTDPETRVALTGAGSPGNESDYFGGATKAAVIKFQEKYRSEVLTPFGLSMGTGLFGVKSREKATVLSLKSEKPLVATTTGSLMNAVQIASTTGQVLVMMPSQYYGKPGTMITISGSGFAPTNNTIYFGADYAVVKASSWNGQSISFEVPKIPKGIYSLYVKNARGESNKEQWFVVTDGVSPVPKINTTDPTAVLRGDTVTLRGSGFLSEGNTIMVDGVGVFKNSKSADGKSLSFVVPASVFPVKFSPSVTAPTLSISIYVVNENGVSNGAIMKLKL